MSRRLAALVAVALVASGCSSASSSSTASEPATSEPTAVVEPQPTPEPAPTPTALPTPTPTPAPDPVVLTGTVVSAVDGEPVASATVALGGSTATTSVDGVFSIDGTADGGIVEVTRPVWLDTSVQWSGTTAPVQIEIEPLVVKALRVAQQVAGDRDSYEELLALADETVINALVFDTKDETDHVLYETEVPFAHEIDAVRVAYDPVEALALAREHGLYAITRIVTFEDPVWASAVPEAKLIGAWVDAANPDNWHYPLDLAVEACGLGFDEIQFDYVRFPSGTTAARARDLVPPTGEERSEVIGSFLAEARSRLHPLGCGVSAAIFGIVMSSATDEGIGQTPERVSAAVDAVSPMLYPSHYSPGWLGFADPNDYPGPVVAYALDGGADRLAPGSLMRPWIQGFYYNGAQVQAQIQEADQRGAGWIIWNALGSYRRDWLPE